MRTAVAAGLSAAALLAASCGPPPPPEPLVSPTGVVFPLGTPPTPTRNSQTAVLYLRQDRTDRALELALEGVAADSTNPVHYYLAGVAYARLGEYALADSMLDVAERLYPAYALDIEPEREAAWGQAFNRGLEAYADGDVERTIEIWTGATQIFDLRPEAHRNLGSLLATEGRYAEAIDVYRDALAGLESMPVARVLTEEELRTRNDVRFEIERSLSELLLLTNRYEEAEPLLRSRLERDPEDVELLAELAAALEGMGREEEARELYGSLLTAEGLELNQIFSLGIGLFRAGQFEEAAEAFRRVTEFQPESRDAWFNYANSLFAAESWDSLAVAGTRLVQLDPLGENGHLMTARALLELGDREGALARLGEAEAAPLYVEGLQLERSGTSVTVYGRVTGNAAVPGTEVALRFWFYGDDGELAGVQDVTVTAPAPDDLVAFEVPFDGTASAYSYELRR